MNLKKHIKYREKCHNKRIKNKNGKYEKVPYYFIITKDDLIYRITTQNGYKLSYGTIDSYKYSNYKSNDIHLNKFLKEYENYMKGKQ